MILVSSVCKYEFNYHTVIAYHQFIKKNFLILNGHTQKKDGIRTRNNVCTSPEFKPAFINLSRFKPA